MHQIEYVCSASQSKRPSDDLQVMATTSCCPVRWPVHRHPGVGVVSASKCIHSFYIVFALILNCSVHLVAYTTFDTEIPSAGSLADRLHASAVSTSPSLTD